MGVGIYLIWPCYYTDLTDSYRPNRRGQLRGDLGGIYFNAILIVVAGGVYLATGFGPLLVFVAFSQAEMLYQRPGDWIAEAKTQAHRVYGFGDAHLQAPPLTDAVQRKRPF